MAKTYIDIVKYMVEAKFEILGLVEKPDIIGAVFGQTEGLLGGDLDLRELQKNGKIGRIEIETSTSGNKTFGRLLLPSSLGRVETCILGAAIESVDRVGPFDTSFKINKIEDTRSSKRQKIVARAKDLLKTLLTTEIPDSKEISEQVEGEVKSSVVTTYGPDALPAGPGIKDNDELILVEGRADVINLLKNDITNCIAVGGAIGVIPKTIIELSKSKDTVLFVDGDRGGDMIIRALSNAAEIDFIARAPDGKEVEELTRKDIIKALRSRVPIDQSRPRSGGGDRDRDGRGRDDYRQRQQEAFNQRRSPPMQQPMDQPHQQPQQQQPQQDDRPLLSPTDISRRMHGRPEEHQLQMEPIERPSERRASLGIKDMNEQRDDHELDIPTLSSSKPAAPSQSQGASSGVEPEQKYIDALSELHNSLRGRIYDSKGSVMAEVPIRELIQTIQDGNGISAIVFDGIITQRLIELASKQGIGAVYGIRAGQISKKFDNMLLFTKELGKI
ncbi:MAG TPA: DNA primase DnaG [Candidatus Baltobacteraceae bacterium]|nr:DNA primase DnaG [Candidatus Baltobacteraceae bacterium]